MTRQEAYNILREAKRALLEMDRWLDEGQVEDAMMWIDPQRSVITIEEIHQQAKAMRRWAFKVARIAQPITTRTRLFIVEVLRSIEA